MHVKRGSKVRVTLVDGTTIGGTVRRSFAWWTLRLEDVTAYDRTGEVPAAGFFLVPKRGILFIQVGD